MRRRMVPHQSVYAPGIAATPALATSRSSSPVPELTPPVLRDTTPGVDA
jgi:hypothetical protein